MTERLGISSHQQFYNATDVAYRCSTLTRIAAPIRPPLDSIHECGIGAALHKTIYIALIPRQTCRVESSLTRAADAVVPLCS